ncbi:MAG: Gamma-glutamyltranspeptidase [Rhizobiales bacterium]|nr:Gamma-glutamyltranspeptidase [Hyphomicrobiales bacterium]
MNSSRSKGVVAAGHRLTAEAATRALREGGTAIDAAIAGLAMACVCEPVLCSPGGGGFATVRNGSSGKISVIDFFPQTPLVRRQPGEKGIQEILVDFGTATQAFHIGPATSAAPGFCTGLQKLHAMGARLSLSELLQPAADAARAGIIITPYQNFLCKIVAPILTATTDAARLFAPGGLIVEPGTTFQNPGLADALEIIAACAPGRNQVTDVAIAAQQANGNLTGADFDAYEAIERNPISIELAGATVHMNPLPAASGILIAHSLTHLEGADPVNIARALLATSQARRAAKGDLAKLNQVPMRQKGTTHLSIIDADGTACAVTVSNGEGNGELVGPFGFMLNNILGEEDVNTHGPEDWPVDTRLASMMCPTLIEKPDGVLIALGSGGSNRIRSAIFQVLAALCLRNEDLAEAIAAARLHIEGGHLDFEDQFDGASADQLRLLCPDHRAWPEPNMFFGGVHAAMQDCDANLSGVGDRRRDGIALLAD